jgi:hypothetical protein
VPAVVRTAAVRGVDVCWETKKVNERRDDTTEPGPESRRAPGSYYYDDATGYERFDPEAEEEKDDGREGEKVPPPQGRRAP